MNTATPLSPRHLTAKWADLYHLPRYWLALTTAQTYCLDARIHIPGCIDVWLHLQCSSAEGALAAWAHWFMKDRADAMCPTVGTMKKRARPAFHLGHASCVHGCIFMSLFYLFVYELSHCSQLWWWCEVTSGWQGGCGTQLESLIFCCSSHLSKKHSLPQLGCENKSENTHT